jgi:hypothetical protein
MRAKLSPTDPHVIAAQIWIEHAGSEFLIRAVLAGLIEENETMRAAIAALPPDIIHMTITD